MILVLLDLTAAFDTVDHYLAAKTICVNIAGSEFSSAPLLCGVPQDSVLEHLVISLYLLPLRSILRKHGISFHYYTDDSQIYGTTKAEGSIFSLYALMTLKVGWPLTF